MIIISLERTWTYSITLTICNLPQPMDTYCTVVTTCYIVFNPLFTSIVYLQFLDHIAIVALDSDIPKQRSYGMRYIVQSGSNITTKAL